MALSSLFPNSIFGDLAWSTLSNGYGKSRVFSGKEFEKSFDELFSETLTYKYKIIATLTSGRIVDSERYLSVYEATEWCNNNIDSARQVEIIYREY
jgi:hypothetical protein